MQKLSDIWDRPGKWYLLFWPVFGLRYQLLEHCNPAKFYHVMHCALDDCIPFLEGFVIPYLFWHVCLMGIHLWLYFHDEKAFRAYSRFLILSMGISTAMFLLYPSCQDLRPLAFPRENFLTHVAQCIYSFDTSTNVCPSEHVIGSIGFFLAARYSRDLSSPGRLTAIGILAFLTAVSTVFLKQHSLVDVMVAIPVSWIGWRAGFRSVYAREESQSIQEQVAFGKLSA